MKVLKILLPALALTVGLPAQTAYRPLTNRDIEAMLAGGVPQSTIALAIQASAARGLVDLDASPSALMALRKEGAGEQVLNAMLYSEPASLAFQRQLAELKAQEQEERAAPGLPIRSGVYYKASSGWVALRRFMLWPPFYSGMSHFGFGRTHRYAAKIDGSHSELQLAAGRPTFYARGSSSSASWRIVRLTSRDNKRLVHLVSRGDFFSTDRFQQTQVRQVRMSTVASDVIALTPVTALEPGEYILCKAVAGAPDLSVCYGFGVQR